MTLYHPPTHDSVREEREILWAGRDLADTALARYESAPEAMMWLARVWRSLPDGDERRVRDSAMAFVEETMSEAERAMYARARVAGLTHQDEMREWMEQETQALGRELREVAA